MLGFPIIIRPSFTLGGVGGGIAYNIEEFRELAERGLELSPVHEVLHRESVIGWKEFELEVMRDRRRQLRGHLLDREHRPDGRAHRRQHHRRAGPDPHRQGIPADARRARRIIRRVGVETGGSNIQFAINPADGRIIVIEMNPRVSRSSALASKATGFPIAKIAAKLALGYTSTRFPTTSPG